RCACCPTTTVSSIRWRRASSPGAEFARAGSDERLEGTVGVRARLLEEHRELDVLRGGERREAEPIPHAAHAQGDAGPVLVPLDPRAAPELRADALHPLAKELAFDVGPIDALEVVKLRSAFGSRTGGRQTLPQLGDH